MIHRNHAQSSLHQWWTLTTLANVKQRKTVNRSLKTNKWNLCLNQFEHNHSSLAKYPNLNSSWKFGSSHTIIWGVIEAVNHHQVERTAIEWRRTMTKRPEPPLPTTTGTIMPNWWSAGNRTAHDFPKQDSSGKIQSTSSARYSCRTETILGGNVSKQSCPMHWPHTSIILTGTTWIIQKHFKGGTHKVDWKEEGERERILLRGSKRTITVFPND